MPSSDRAKTFDFTQVVSTINGAPLEGFIDANNAVSVAFPNNLWSKKVGADGKVTRVYTAKTDGMITFRMHYGSVGAQLIDTLTRTDRLTRRTPQSILIIDTISRTRVFAANAWLEKMPDFDLGNELADLEFPFQTANLVMELRSAPES